MGVTKLPSFYDHLGQGIADFSENRRRRSEADMNRKIQTLQFLAGEHSAGNLPTESFQSWLAANKIPGLEGFKPGPSQVEQKDAFIASLPTDQQGEARAERFGITPPKQRQQTQAKGEIDLRVGRANATTAEVNAAHASENANNAIAATRLQLGDATSKQYDEAASRYIGASVQGKKLDPSSSRQVVDAAVNKYMADRSASRAGVIPDTEIPILRAHFENAFNDAMVEQRKMDIQAMAASNRPGDDDRTFARLVQLENNIATRAQGLLDQINGPSAIYSKTLNPEMHATLEKQYKDEIEKRAAVRRAMATLDPSDIRKAFLAEEAPSAAGTTTPPAGGAAVVPPGGRAGGAGGAGAPLMKPDEYRMAKQVMSQMDAAVRKQYLDRKMANGALNKADYDKLVKELGIK